MDANPAGQRLFPAHLLHATWHTFAAAGYARLVTGIVYRGQPRPTCGMPLGGVDTGCLDIEPNGMLGYCTLFNHLVNPRLLLNLPFLGMSCDGSAWVLVSDRLGKADRPVPNQSIATFPPTDYTPQYHPVGLEGVQIADAIDYWGHFPVLDMEYQTSAPVAVGLRAWSPFLPGDAMASMLPGAVFEVHLRNPSRAAHRVTLAMSFPGFELPPEELGAPAAELCREELDGDLKGVWIESGCRDDAWQMGYVLAAAGEEGSVRWGGGLGADGQAWAAIDRQLPAAGAEAASASVAVDLELPPGAVRVCRLVLAWNAPQWRAGGSPHRMDTDLFTHMYASLYPEPLSAARILARDHQRLFRRIAAWQEVLYQDAGLPGWLADSLINILHLVPECSVWAQAWTPIGLWCRPEDGLFGMNECPRGCPQIECLPCSFYGNIPLVYFFPEAALSTLRGYKAYQFPDGRPPWIFGGVTAREEANRPPYEMARPDRGYQTVLNGACYVVMVDRYWRRTGDDAVLREFWDSVKRANDFSMGLRPSYGPAQVVAMPEPGTDGGGLGDTEWFEAPEPGWKGYVTHAGGVRMAQVALMRRMAEAMGDGEYAARCDGWLQAGGQALEQHLWAGEYYLNFHEPETGNRSDLVFGYQLDGQWICRWHGVDGVFPPERVARTLATIRRVNCSLSQSGAVNYAQPDGSPARVGGYGTYSYFPPELFMLAMNYAYEGERAFGLDLLRRCLENVNCRWGYTWDAPNILRGEMDTGQRAFGADYYQDLMLWGVPAALAGQPLEGVCGNGGLVDRVIRAARGETG